MIRTIIFDLGGVIVPLDFPGFYSAIAEHCPYSPAEIPQRIGATGLVEDLECGRVSPERFEEVVGEALALKLPRDGFHGLWARLFKPPETLIPESLIASLASRYRLLLLSNTNAIHFPYIREHYPLLAHFDDAVLSHEVGSMKPRPEIYRKTIELAACRPEECFFTDDGEANVEAARKEGIDAERFVSVEALKQQLRDRNVRF